ncbi:Histone-lysine N-methyltransferase SUVR5, partial [Linum perenne]
MPHAYIFPFKCNTFKLVKDLSIARRFIMQKLAVGMLNIVDQFHNEVMLIVTAFEQAESTLQVEPVSVMAFDNSDSYHARNGLLGKFDQPSVDYAGKEVQHCVGSNALDNNAPCHESPKRYTLYCHNHIPSWLKRARNGRSRIISKEVFLDLLKGCCSVEQKLHLHQ